MASRRTLRLTPEHVRLAMERARANLRLAIRWQKRNGPEPRVVRGAEAYGPVYSGAYSAMLSAEAWLRAGLGGRSYLTSRLRDAAVAQRTEQAPFKRRVGGSTPPRRTKSERPAEKIAKIVEAHLAQFPRAKAERLRRAASRVIASRKARRRPTAPPKPRRS